MRPLVLSIEGLRSFRTPPVEIDFRDKNQLAVIGDTGAGKSSILEAMTYALYGRTTFSGGGNRELMNDTSQRMRVVLRFRVSDEEWEVARTLRRTQQGAVQNTGVQLRRTSPEGETVEKARLVDKRVEELLGLDCDAFLRTVVLPQGRFARLLVEDKPSERGKILGQVWPAVGVDAARTAAEAALGRVEKVRRRTEAEVEASGYPEDPGAHLEELVRLRDDAERQADAAGALEEEAKAGRAKLNQAEEQIRVASDAARRLDLDRIDRAAGPIGRLAAAAAEIDEVDGRLDDCQTEAREVLDDLGPDEEPRRNEVAAALYGLNRLDGLAAQATERAKAWRSKWEAAEELRQKVASAQADEAKASEAAARHEEERPALAKAMETARERCEEARRRHEEGVSRRQDAERARERLTEAEQQKEAFAEESKTATKKNKAAQAAAVRADALLADAGRAHAAASVAADLEAGDDCPVCARELPSEWSAPEAASLDKAEQFATTARDDAQKARDAATRAHARLGEADKRVAQARSEREAANQSFRDALAELDKVARAAGLIESATTPPDAPAATDDEASDAARLHALPGQDALLAPLDDAYGQAEAAMRLHDEEQAKLTEAATRSKIAAAKARQASEGARQLADEARKHGDAALKELTDTVAAIAEPFRPALKLPADATELEGVDTAPATDCMETATEQARALEARQKQRRQLQQALDQAGQEREALALRRRKEVEAPLGEIGGALSRARDALMGAASALNAGDQVPGPAPVGPPAAVKVWAAQLQDATAAIVDTANRTAKAASADAEAARRSLTALGRRLADADSDAQAAQAERPTDPDDVETAAVKAAEHARHLRRDAIRRAADFDAIHDDVTALHALVQESRDLGLALDDLRKALLDGGFPKWLTLRRSRTLLVHASQVLKEITRGRYTFEDPEEREEWRIVDMETREPRSPSSLSGGEQFVASLALAVGMVEAIAREGDRLDALFLDEGFGALDRHNLDAAVEALGAVAARGRMVGVISHLRAVAERIDHVLAVERTATGSQAKWLARDQRNRLSRDDADAETASALEGLLE